MLFALRKREFQSIIFGSEFQFHCHIYLPIHSQCNFDSHQNKFIQNIKIFVCTLLSVEVMIIKCFSTVNKSNENIGESVFNCFVQLLLFRYDKVHSITLNPPSEHNQHVNVLFISIHNFSQNSFGPCHAKCVQCTHRNTLNLFVCIGSVDSQQQPATGLLK